MYIYEELSERAEIHPNKVGLVDISQSLTYKSIFDYSILIGSFIIEALEKTINHPVVVLIDKNVNSIVSFFGVSFSGNFYVPIDIAQPMSRIQLIIETLSPKLIINASDNKKLRDIKFSYTNFSDIILSAQPQNREIIEQQNKLIDTDPLYSIFTSGSTGVPKGVLVSYRSVFDLINQFSKEFSFDEDTVFGNQAPFDFDVSVKDIYNSIRVGAKIVIIPKICFSFPAKLVSYLNEHKINTVIWAAAVLRIVENLHGLEAECPKYLTKIMFSGEVMSNKTLNYWRRKLPDTDFVNLYGPTEITCNCSYYRVNDEFKDDDILPIGVPFENTRILLISDENSLISRANEVGEICVTGSSLSLGYFNNTSATEKAFVQNPLNNNYHELIYRTGDLGKYGQDGLLYFIGRRDHQVKHMGHRIELSEIEYNVNSLDYIEASCCLYDHNNEKIVLFYQSATNDNKRIFHSLLSILPKYMIPNEMIHFSKLPLNNNDKINRQYLKKEYIDESN